MEGLANVQKASTLVLDADRSILVADPRCARTLEQRVMMYLGTKAAGSSPAEVAEAMEVSLRQAQRVLKSLREQGVAVGGERRGAGYRIEDTTFLEPTRSRVFAPPPKT